VLAVPDAIEMFRTLDPAPARVAVKGYHHHASAHARLENRDVLMAFVLAEKAAGSAATTFDIDLNG
jgi:hypothetical protein